jgi:hypothetical protein
MRCKVQSIVLLMAAAMATAAAIGHAQNPMQGPPPNTGAPGPKSDPLAQAMADNMAVAGPLKIAFGKKSAEWTPKALAVLPHKTITVFNEHAKAKQAYAGVALMDLLKPLGVPDNPHGKDLKLYLVAEGADGYQAVYSVAEVNPDVHLATVIVADTMDGKGLAGSGPFELIATGEKVPTRWVHNLAAIRVLTAP